MNEKLSCKNVSVIYINPRNQKKTEALSDINLEIKEGEFVSIVGPSGCGKSTFLNAIDGLVNISSGQIRINGKVVKSPGKDRAMVFQEASLIPWRTVIRNVIYGLEIQSYPKDVILERAKHYIKLVGLLGFENHYPHELSGGMKQRINLARALCCDPELLLLDEPFASLDAQTREFMQSELLRIWSATKRTALFITHQINEAIFLSDRVIIFSSRPGHIITEFKIDFERPRKLSIKRTPEFLNIEDQIWKLIETEVMKQSGFEKKED